MSIAKLESYYHENGETKTKELLKQNITITEKISGHRVYCKKEKTGNILFYSKKKSNPINLLDRIVTDLYEPFIKHIIRYKEKLEIGEYSFYYQKNNIYITNIPKKSKKTITEVAIDLNVNYITSIFNGKLSDEIINNIINYIVNNTKISLEQIVNNINKNYLINKEIDGIVLKIDNDLYKLDNDNCKKIEYAKVNTASYELLLIEIFDFVKSQDFSVVKFTSKNELFKRAEFTYEMFNRFIDFHQDNLDNYLLEIPEFLKNNGKLNKRYINNKRTLELLNNKQMEYLLRIFITALKDVQKPRGIINQDFAEEHNYIILKINEYVKNSNAILDFNDFRRYTSGNI